MNKIIMTVNTTEKDITSSMIKRDLLSLNSFLRTYENIEKKSEHSDPVEDSSEGDVANSEAESDLNAAKGNNTGSNIIEVVGVDKDDGVTVVMKPSETDNFENNIKANISKNMSSILSKLANVTLVDVAEVVFKSGDPEVDGSPNKETNSQPAEIHLMRETLEVVTIKKYESEQAVSPSPNLAASIEMEEVVLKSVDPLVDGKPAEDTNSSPASIAATINTTPAPIGEAIEQGMDAAEVATKSTPSPAPTARTSTAEAKSTETANRYLESLKSKWSANENGYFEVSNPFYITSEMPTSKMLSQAYLLPEGKQLEFFGKKGEPSKLSGNRLMHGEHELRDDLDLTNEKRGTRPYLKLEVKLESKPFQSSTKVAQNPAVLRLAEEYKKSLITIYTDSVQKISDEYKKTNPGKELETLVIAPITSTDGILLEVESTALVTAIKEIQHSNPGLKIAISADKEAHSDAIRAAYEK